MFVRESLFGLSGEAMGIVRQEAVFNGVLPSLERIANAISDICGLPVAIEDFPKPEQHELYEMHAFLSFVCDPENQVTVYSYSPGAVRRFHDTILEGTIPNFEKSVQGMNESPGEQSVYLSHEIGYEPSIFILTSLALEKLGGQLRNELSEEIRKKYNRQITPEMVNNRRKKKGKSNLAFGIVYILFFPLILVFGIISAIVSLPSAIMKAFGIGRTDGSSDKALKQRKKE